MHEKVYKEFIGALRGSARRRCKVGNGLDDDVQMGPCVNDSQRGDGREYVGIAKGEGAKLLTGGNRLD